MSFTGAINDLATVDIFKEAKKPEWFIGRPYYLDFDKAYLLITDAWKEKVGGIPQGTFLLAFYENANDAVDECLLLRAIKPAKLPTDNDVIASMVEYYKDNLKTSGKNSQLDDFTKYTFSFSGLECRILGTFYRDEKEEVHDKKNKIQFGADVENYYSAHNYAAYKPMGSVLEQIVNFRDGSTLIGKDTDLPIGIVRYSSSCRFQDKQMDVPVYVSASDFLGKRTALFGMTRTGKSNTVKKIIEATTSISNKAKNTCIDKNVPVTSSINQIEENGIPKNKVGQIIFDMNGEYANKNLQDEGTAIFEKFKPITTRYSVLEKDGFKVMKTNFYTEIESGFEMICSMLENEEGDYVKSFCAVDLTKPDKPDSGEPDEQYWNQYTRWARKSAAYQCCLKKAGFQEPANHKVYFKVAKELNEMVFPDSDIDPSKGIGLNDAIIFWEWIAKHKNDDYFTDYKKKNKKDWVDEDLDSLLTFLTKKSSNKTVSGYKKLRPCIKLHTAYSDNSFETDIVEHLRKGEIVIVDLSQGDPNIQKTFSQKICSKIFRDSMERFVNSKPNNYIQFYFEEAHNLFPKKDDKDLSAIYNRLAKEGAKLNLGLIYATQEVSSISSNILKNTQNWFIAHLNNEDELKEIRKFYDFADFCDGLVRYSAGSDKGFIRMKTYSNAFIVPVQIDKFTAEKA